MCLATKKCFLSAIFAKPLTVNCNHMNAHKASVLLGLFIYTVCVSGLLFQEATMVMMFSLLFPGLLFGLSSLLHRRKIGLLKRILFVVLCVLTYILSLIVADLKNFDHKLSALKIVLASIVGAILIKLWNDLLSKNRLSFRNTFAIPFTIGFGSSLISATSAFVLDKIEPYQGWNNLVWFGLFSIFPLWQISMSRCLRGSE